MRNNPLGLSAAMLSVTIGCLFVTGHVSAETLGTASPLDSRVQTAMYTPDNVFRIQAYVGRTSLVQFPANETVNEDSGLIVSGDPTAWSIGANKAGNMVAIKPVSLAEPNTNLTINTNRHTYLLELKLVKRVEDMTYALRWTYPEPVKKALANRNVPADPCQGNLINRNYQRRGDLQLSPTEGWDNGRFTCFRFANNSPRPIVLTVLPDGTEKLANVRTVQNIMVVHGVSDLFRFRMNTLVMEARTQQQETTFNFDGTTTGEIRELKHENQ
ncbi:TrbG/VirB9 family P-type conjugative transfer protein [Pseudomonas kitaguniensis]|uniref:TrbG/VirB9 family P-type conjugative transfer protein n=1 Tax=Pseudomonas kitaguniensis TaxID=2607908 RepID=UPI003B9ECA57